MPRVLVLGAGYAGAHAARAARDGGADVTVVAPAGRHDLTPRLATVAAGAAPLGDGFAPLASLVDGIQVVDARATAVDADRKLVRTDGDERTYDALVVTLGSRPTDPAIPGLATHARTLRTADDAAAIRRALDTDDRVVIVGGGPTGTQLAAEVAAARPQTDVALVELGDHLMAGLGRTLGDHAERLLRSRGVRVVKGHGVVRVGEHRVDLDDGRTLEGIPIWCGGFAPAGHDLLPDAPSIAGRLKVDRFLRTSAGRDVFVAGDAAAHRDVVGRRLAMSAQIALQAGKAAGANAARAADGRRLSPARLFDLGWVATLGDGRGVAKLGPVPVAAPVLDRLVPLMHHAVDVRHLYLLGGLPALVAHGAGQHDLTVAEERELRRASLHVVPGA